VALTSAGAADKTVTLTFEDAAAKRRVVNAVKQYQASVEGAGALLPLPFTSVDDYFFLLKLVAESVAPWNERALFFLAAAVSDFYIPQQQLATHKIQSREGPLKLTLEPVPKLLGVLRREWAPRAFVVSFKLETDWDLLRKKAHQAIEKYDVHLVVANELHSRFNEVLLIPNGSAGGKSDERVIERPEDHLDIESTLVDAVAGVHFKFIASHDVSVPDDVGFRLPGRGSHSGYRAWRRRLPAPVQSALVTIEQHREEIAGVVLGGLLSVFFNMLQAQLRRRSS
jgi:hypothetical protein